MLQIQRSLRRDGSEADIPRRHPNSECSEGADELVETLEAIIFQQRLVDFALQLEGTERLIFEHRMLTPKPTSIAELAPMLGMSRKRVATRVHDLERRMRAALRGDPHRLM